MMRIQDYVHVLLKRWWVILLVMVAAAGAAYVVSKARTPTYRSRAIYGVYFNRLDTGGNLFAADLFNGYVSGVYQPDQLQVVSDQLQLDQSGQALMEYVRLQAQPDVRQIVVEADYFDPATAQALAAVVGEQLNAFVVELNRNLSTEDTAFLKRVQSASNAWLAKPNTRINVLAAVLLGGVLGVLLSFVLEYLDDTLKTTADVERFAGLSTIGAIPASSAPQGRRARLRPAAASGLVAPTGRAASRSERDRA